MRLGWIFSVIGFTAVVGALSNQTSNSLGLSPPGPINGTTEHYVTVRSKRYYYMRSRPTGEYRGTILLMHGFPDLAIGWKHQIPFLSSLGYQVIAPDMLGYGNTDSPEDLQHWAYKELVTDLALLLDTIVPGEQVILGGHDWGAFMIYRFALWYPQLFRAMFTISIPLEFIPLDPEFKDVPELINSTRPTLGYQLFVRDFAADRRFQTLDQYRQLINAAFYGVTADGKPGFSGDTAWVFENLPNLVPNQLLSPEEFEYYATQYFNRGVRGGANYYRISRINWEDDREVLEAGYPRYKLPTLYIASTKEAVSLPEYADGMENYFDNLTIAEPVEAGHWVMLDAPDSVNNLLEEWLADLV